jgi:uncharacterized protein involved in exopolysaccharide biosynthesis
MVSSILKLLGSVFSIAEHKIKNKYKEEYLRLEREYYEEEQKTTPNHARMDNIERELQLLVDSVCSEIKGPKA